jgi:cytochrome bd-type quinol oxidase subunit 1
MLERLLFWIAILVLAVAVIGEISKLSALEQQAQKAQSMEVNIQGEEAEGGEE